MDIYSDTVTYMLILTDLNKYLKCSLYYDSLIIQIDLAVAEIHAVTLKSVNTDTCFLFANVLDI